MSDMICADCRQDTPRDTVVEVPGPIDGMPLFMCPTCADRNANREQTIADAIEQGQAYEPLAAWELELLGQDDADQLPCTWCLSTDHKPGTTHTGQNAYGRAYPPHTYRAPARWWLFTEHLVKGYGWCVSYGHSGKTRDEIREYARGILETYPLVLRVRVRIAYHSPEHKPSTTQDYVATVAEPVEVINR